MNELDKLLTQLPIPLSFIIAEEIRESIVEELKGLRVEEVTQSLTVRDRVIEGVYELLNVVGRGRVRELVLITDNPNVNIYVEVDTRPIINHTLIELQQLSEVLEGIDVFERNDSYILRVSNISFIERCYVVVKPLTKAVIRHAFALYNLF